MILFALLSVMFANAQDDGLDSIYQIVKDKGVYEQKRVVTVDNVNAATLYSRAMEALSDWTGPDGRSKAGLDYCDKEVGLVTYKGDFYNGSMKTIGIGGDIPIYTDFTLKVRCKDGRAQVSVSVPGMHYFIPKRGTISVSILEVLEKQMKMSEEERENAKKKVVRRHTMREIVDTILNAMTERLKVDPDDDF